MSVKVGDRYACPDSECGCKVEVRTISRSSVRNVETRTSEVPETGVQEPPNTMVVPKGCE